MTLKADAKRDRVGNKLDPVGQTSNFFGREKEPGKRLLWRLCAWAIVTMLAVTSAVWINRTAAGLRNDRLAYDALSEQAQQIELMAKNAQDETKQLASNVKTLNSDRDRLYARVTSVEQSLDTVTGSIGKQPSSTWPQQSAAPVLSAPSTTHTPPHATPDKLSAIHGEQPPGAAAGESAPLPAAENESTTTQKPQLSALASPAENQPLAGAHPSTSAGASSIQRTDFAVDLGSANSIEGLRALWRGSSKDSPALLGSLQPLIVVKERHDGLGLQLHLVAGPLQDAAAAAKLCANLIAIRHSCETTVFDGQRLALNSPAPVREKPRRKPRTKPEKPLEQAHRPLPPPQPLIEPRSGTGRQ